MTRTLTVQPLGDYETGLLARITGSAVSFAEQGWQAQATVAFVDRDGSVYVGPVRCARRQEGHATRYEVVVAGAIFATTEEQILSVNWGIPVPLHGEPSVRLEVTGRGTVVVDPERAGSLGCIPWNLTYRPSAA